MVLVDSSAWIEALRRNGKLEVKVAIEGLLEAYEALWCSPVRLEVIGGARREERQRIGMHFSVIPYHAVSRDDWNDAVALAWKLRDNGLTVPWLDVLIATVAIRREVRLYTIDAHFAQIANVAELQLYKPGYGGMFSPE